MAQLTQKSRFNRISWRSLRENPITIKELRSRMRGRRAFVVLTVYLLLMCLFITLVYGAFAASASQMYGPSLREGGYTVFVCMLFLQGFLVIFVGPSFTASSITGEKERQTYDLLRTTLLSPNAFVLGKLLSALSYVFLLLLTAIPLQSIAFLLGGITIKELILSQVVFFVAALAFAMWGLYCSSAMRTTLSASVTTYAGALLVTVGTPIIGFFSALIFSSMIDMFTSISHLEGVVIFIGSILASTNLPVTLAGSMSLLISENAMFFYEYTTRTTTTYIPSPWILFVVFYLFLSWVLYRRCVNNVSRIANQ